MRTVFLFAVLFSLSAQAFDSTAWLARRAEMAKVAESLRAQYAEVAKKVADPAENVTIPIETYEDGAVKTSVFATKAQFFRESAYVWASGVVVQRYDRDGRVKMRLDAENCLIDRFGKCGWVEGRAELTHGKTRLAGKGAFFSSAENYVSVKADSDIESHDLKMGGVR